MSSYNLLVHFPPRPLTSGNLAIPTVCLEPSLSGLLFSLDWCWACCSLVLGFPLLSTWNCLSLSIGIYSLCPGSEAFLFLGLFSCTGVVYSSVVSQVKKKKKKKDVAESIVKTAFRMSASCVRLLESGPVTFLCLVHSGDPENSLCFSPRYISYCLYLMCSSFLIYFLILVDIQSRFLKMDM